jgi:hypothetical protein
MEHMRHCPSFPATRKGKCHEVAKQQKGSRGCCGFCPPPPPIFRASRTDSMSSRWTTISSFKIRGRIFVDGGVSSRPEKGNASQLNIPQPRDAFVALSYFNPVMFQVGNFYAPFSLERINLKLYIDFIERTLPTEGRGPNRNIGFAAFTGQNWTPEGRRLWHESEDKVLAPLPGVHQYWDLAGRVTLPPS